MKDYSRTTLDNNAHRVALIVCANVSRLCPTAALSEHAHDASRS